MSLFTQFGVDKSKVENGVEVKFGKNEDKTIPTFYVSRAHASNKEYKKSGEVAFRPYRRQIELKTLAEDIAEDVMLDLFVSSVLKGWQNVRNEEGETLDFTPENAKWLMLALPDLYEELQSASNDASLFRIANREADAKN